MDLSNAKNIYKKFRSDKIKNANIIIDLLKELEGKDVKILRKAVAVIHKIFCQLIKDGDISVPKNWKQPIAQYNTWLHERYLEVHDQLLKMVLNQEFPMSLREISLTVIIKLMQKETNHPVTKEKIHKINFPIQKLTNLYNSILSSEATSSILIKKFNEYLQCPDFLLVSLHVLAQIVPKTKQEEMHPLYLENLISLLQFIELPEDGKKALDIPQLFIDYDKDPADEDCEMRSHEFSFPYVEAKEYFNQIWEKVLNFKFNSKVYKHCLVLLPEKVLMHLYHPVRLTDFFMNAYNLGGVVSILAMHGVYILVTQFNLEYPNFYDKVYALFEPTIFHASYKPRFFMLCNKFFLSPYLPEYVIAAFIKRSCRLMLTAPSPCLTLLLKFVTNLLLRYPGLQRLVNSPDATSFEDDPFLENEVSPQACKAGESSLWEVATLQQHPVPSVARAATFIGRNLPDVEHDISRHIETSSMVLYEKASKVRDLKVAITFTAPDSLFKYSDDAMSTHFDIL